MKLISVKRPSPTPKPLPTFVLEFTARELLWLRGATGMIASEVQTNEGNAISGTLYRDAYTLLKAECPKLGDGEYDDSELFNVTHIGKR